MDVIHLLTPAAPRPIAPFLHATIAMGFVFVTGQMPIDLLAVVAA